MTDLHAALTGALVRDLVNDALDEIGAWAPSAASQGAGLNPKNAKEAAADAIACLMADVHDHLGIRIGVTLATHGITADGGRA